MCCTRIIRQKHYSYQEDQGQQSYWSTHGVNVVLPADLPPPGKHQNNMCPLVLAVHHPAYGTILGYATVGCLVSTGRNCTKEEIHLVVMRGAD